MKPEAILKSALERGVTISLAPTGDALDLTFGKDCTGMTEALRGLIRSHKPELIEHLRPEQPQSEAAPPVAEPYDPTNETKLPGFPAPAEMTASVWLAWAWANRIEGEWCDDEGELHPIPRTVAKLVADPRKFRDHQNHDDWLKQIERVRKALDTRDVIDPSPNAFDGPWERSEPIPAQEGAA
jgi:hypothetical protein